MSGVKTSHDENLRKIAVAFEQIVRIYNDVEKTSASKKELSSPHFGSIDDAFEALDVESSSEGVKYLFAFYGSLKSFFNKPDSDAIIKRRSEKLLKDVNELLPPPSAAALKLREAHERYEAVAGVVNTGLDFSDDKLHESKHVYFPEEISDASFPSRSPAGRASELPESETLKSALRRTKDHEPRFEQTPVSLALSNILAELTLIRTEAFSQSPDSKEINQSLERINQAQVLLDGHRPELTDRQKVFLDDVNIKILLFTGKTPEFHKNTSIFNKKLAPRVRTTKDDEDEKFFSEFAKLARGVGKPLWDLVLTQPLAVAEPKSALAFSPVKSDEAAASKPLPEADGSSKPGL